MRGAVREREIKGSRKRGETCAADGVPGCGSGPLERVRFVMRETLRRRKEQGGG